MKEKPRHIREKEGRWNIDIYIYIYREREREGG